MSVYISVKKKLPYVKNILEDIGYIYDPAGNDTDPDDLNMANAMLILWNDKTYSYSYDDGDSDYEVFNKSIKDIVSLCKRLYTGGV